MDGTEDSLTMGSQHFKEVENRPSCLRVEARAWLIKEKQKLWSCGKLNTNGQFLSLLNIEAWNLLAFDEIWANTHKQLAFARNTDDCLGVRLHP